MSNEKRTLNEGGLPRLTIDVDGGHINGGYTIKDERTPEDMHATIGFWVATDSTMSNWTDFVNDDSPIVNRSIVACPVRDHDDYLEVEKRFRARSEFKRVRYTLGKVTEEGRILRPKMNPYDCLHIYDLKKSFRYPL